MIKHEDKAHMSVQFVDEFTAMIILSNLFHHNQERNTFISSLLSSVKAY